MALTDAIAGERASTRLAEKGPAKAGLTSTEKGRYSAHEAVDISGSMDGNMIAGTALDARTAAAMALVTASVEPHALLTGFTAGDAGISELAVSPKWRLDQVVEYMQGLEMGGTDCALPILWARAGKLDFDAFVVYTDSETWAGDVHPMSALNAVPPGTFRSREAGRRRDDQHRLLDCGPGGPGHARRRRVRRRRARPARRFPGRLTRGGPASRGACGG